MLKTEILKTESVFNEKIKNLQVQLDTEQNKNKDLNLTIAGINSKIEIMNEVLLESISNAKNEKISNQSKENKILSNNSSTNFEKNDVDNHQEKKIIENNSESEKNSKIEKNFSKESKIIPETQVLNKNSVKTEDFMKINSESPSIRKNSNWKRRKSRVNKSENKEFNYKENKNSDVSNSPKHLKTELRSAQKGVRVLGC